MRHRKLTLYNLSLAMLYFFPVSLFLGNAATEIAMCIIGILFLAHCTITKDFKWLENDWIKCAFIFWAYMCLRSLFAENPLIALARGLPFIRYIFFAAAIAFWLLKDKEIKKNLTYSLTFSVLFFGISAITQYAVGYDFFGNSYTGSTDNIRLTIASGKMSIGIITSMIFFPAALYLLHHNKTLALLYFLIGTLTVFLSGERTAFIMLAVGFVITIFSNKKTRVYFILFGIALSIAISTLHTTQSTVVNRQINSTYNEISNFTNSSYGRIYTTATELFLTNPIFGIGLRHFQSECLSDNYNPSWLNPEKSHLTKAYLCVTHPHNIYLELATETGAVGIILFIIMIGCWFRFMWKNRTQLLRDPIKFGASINIFLKLIPIAASSSLFIAWPTAPLWFMVGLLYSKNTK